MKILMPREIGPTSAASVRARGLNSILAFNPLRSWFRAKIPLPLSVPLAQACRAELEKE